MTKRRFDLDTATSWVERPIRRVSGSGLGPDAGRFNPLPHAGTISVFLLIVVVASGLYITLFFQYGYEASYDAVLGMEQHPIQRTVRALHRYSSAALVVTTMVHAWRIFVAGRFTPRRRRWRWLTGVATLLLLWPAGVSGYLLVWDTRAGAIGEAIAAPLSVFGFGTAWGVRHLSTASSLTGSSGSTFMVVVWFLHLGLTGVIGFFAFRHLRRSKLAWLPERRWMLAMGGSLLVASVLLPVGMLGPVDANDVGVSAPIDPFVLFLLPALDGPGRWLWLIGLTMVAGAVGMYPFARRIPATPSVEVIEPNCTGCNLCVIDCPYDALAAVGDLVAVEPEACTSCGICLGSCAFGALTFPGEEPAVEQMEGATVVVACDRHDLGDDELSTLVGPGGRPVVRHVRCAGVVGVDLVKSMTGQGAERIEIVGCAPDDCRYGVGNTLAQARIEGDQAPHLARAHRSKVGQHWVATGELIRSIDAPAAEVAGERSGTRALVGSSALVLVSALIVAAATFAPFNGESAAAAVRVVVDQEPDRGLVGAEDFASVVEAVEVTVDGIVVGSVTVDQWRGNAVALERWSVDPGPHDVVVEVVGATATAVLFDDSVDLTANQQLNVVVRSPELTAAADEGRDVFFSRESGCSVCHSVEPGDTVIGPSLHGVATRAESRVEGLDARTYLWQSILLPDEYVVEGYPAGQMLPVYREQLSQEQLDALLAYMLTLTDDGTDAEESSE